jgi:hypothetical protein
MTVSFWVAVLALETCTSPGSVADGYRRKREKEIPMKSKAVGSRTAKTRRLPA